MPSESFIPVDKIASFPERAQGNALESGLTRFESLITPDIMRQDYLFGLKLESALTNQAISDETLQRYINRAISNVEIELKINVNPVKYTDRYDYNLWDYQKYNYIQLNHWPVVQIESIKAKYPNAVDFIQFPSDWISLYNEFGLLQLTPTNGNITQFFLTNDATYIPLILGSRSNWPQLWQVTYTSGFINDRLPAVINNLIAQNATLQILRLLNPVLFPFNSYGISLDGVSQSVGGPGPQLLTERINETKEEYAKLMNDAKRYWNKNILISSLGA